MHIIKVPSVYFVKLSRRWLNLALIRQVDDGDFPNKIVVVWDTGEFDIFKGLDAQGIIDALKQTPYIDKSD